LKRSPDTATHSRPHFLYDSSHFDFAPAAVGTSDPGNLERATDPFRGSLSRGALTAAAHLLPGSPLTEVILATLSERMPSIREAVTWVALLQRSTRTPKA
jgi:hypothetical protein